MTRTLEDVRRALDNCTLDNENGLYDLFYTLQCLIEYLEARDGQSK